MTWVFIMKKILLNTTVKIFRGCILLRLISWQDEACQTLMVRRQVSLVYLSMALRYLQEQHLDSESLAGWMLRQRERSGHVAAGIRRWGYGSPLALAEGYLKRLYFYNAEPEIRLGPGVIQIRHQPIDQQPTHWLPAMNVRAHDLYRVLFRYLEQLGERVGVEGHFQPTAGAIEATFVSRTDRAVSPPGPPPSPRELAALGFRFMAENLGTMLGAAMSLTGGTPEMLGKMMGSHWLLLKRAQLQQPVTAGDVQELLTALTLAMMDCEIPAFRDHRPSEIDHQLAPGVVETLATFDVYPDHVARYLNALGRATGARFGLGVVFEVGFQTFRATFLSE